VICAAALLGAFPAAGAALSRPADRRPADQIQVSVPARVNQRSVYDVTIRGFSRTHATAYVFIDYSACARSFAAERRRAPNESDDYAVKGSFAEVSGWKSSSADIDHACAYLIATPSGSVLASARLSFEIH
jgi:hypothetical protein